MIKIATNFQEDINRLINTLDDLERTMGHAVNYLDQIVEVLDVLIGIQLMNSEYSLEDIRGIGAAVHSDEL